LGSSVAFPSARINGSPQRRWRFVRAIQFFPQSEMRFA
jgi:hypothetical protein